MATMTVVKLETADGADHALGLLEQLLQQNSIRVQDAAVVSRKQGNKKPKSRQSCSPAWAGALGGSFWGLQFGLIASNLSTVEETKLKEVFME